jgi:hypothetical protein
MSRVKYGHHNVYPRIKDAPNMTTMEDYNTLPVVPPMKDIFFLNDKIMRKHHTYRSEGIVTVYDIWEDKLVTLLLDEFVRNKKGAYSVSSTGKLVNRNPKYVADLVKKGELPEPIVAMKDGKRGFRKRSYFSEDTVYEIRDYFSSKGWGSGGRTRHPDLKTNNRTPTVAEMQRRMGKSMVSYTRTEEGKYLPVWDSTM